MSNDTYPGLYLHIPFCKSKCPYCNFYSETELSGVTAWQNALVKEMLLYKNHFPAFDSLYLGGGTPTVLEDAVLRNLFDHLYRHFQFTPDTEITIEANPNDITRAKLQLLKACGVNRISLGVQSFDAQVITFLKRRHSVGEAEQALDLIQESGFATVSVDLMYGIPGQAREGWLKTLERALTFHPAHLSCYQLTVAEGTELGERNKRGVITLPDEAEETALFLDTAHCLAEHGYLHYEISNFASGEATRSRHNQKYWQHTPYLGLGPSAHSFRQGKRWWNHRSIEEYCSALSAGKAPVSGKEHLTREQLDLESLYLGLRTSAGVDLTRLNDRSACEAVLPGLLKEDYVALIGQRMVPTRKGFLVADRLAGVFMGR
jgi:oxygen-independent coproporphyrinogen-3 oxidase